MECNKEEAIRAKEIAEKKMLNNDFAGARRTALKAQQLFPELENITRLLAVCDVHCSAESRILGSERDWYSILQVERFADEMTIKKQYRKLALVLHPDKNKFPGAEAAFKLIGEAHLVLSDHSKRSLFDRRIGISRTSAQQPKPPSHQVNMNPPSRKHGMQNNAPNGFSTQFSSLNHHQTTQANSTAGQKSFWTCCPFCNVKYLYNADYVNRVLRCQKCSKPYVAYDIAAQGVFQGSNQSQAAAGQSIPRQSNWSQPSVFKPKDVPIKENYRTGVHKNAGSSASNLGSQVNTSSRSVSSVSGTETSSANAGLGSRVNDNANSMNGVNEGAAVPKEDVMKAGEADVRNQKRKRGKKHEPESSESYGTSSSSDLVDINLEESASNPAGVQGSGMNGFHASRRSSRQKHQVSYNESGTDDDFESPLKKSRKGKSSSNGEGSQPGIVNDTPYFADAAEKKEKVSPTEGAKVCKNEATRQEAGTTYGGAENIEIIDNSESDDNSCPEFFSCPDPEFNDFDKDRDENCFAVGQFWACYDDVDGMPRFYAQIRKVVRRTFKVHITWLEADPDDQDQINWAEELPVGCGKFKQEKYDVITGHSIFSHQVLCDKGEGEGIFIIYPRKDETWALFKDWDINWSGDPSNHKKYKYEIVQVVSDFVEDAGIRVTFLEKVKGFVSLFQQRSKNGAPSLLIPPNEIFRFSHRIPSFNMSGTGREGVPEGCFELDPACLPANPDDICYPIKVEGDDEIVSVEPNGSHQQSSKVNVSKLSKTDITTENSAEFVRKSGFVGETCKVRRSPRGLKIAEKENNDASASTASIQRETAICMNGGGGKSSSKFSPMKADDSSSKIVKELDVRMQESSPSKSNSIHQSLSPGSKVSEDFHNFMEDKVEWKFKQGQIWALYMPEHKLPKMYGQIKKVGGSPFMLHVAAFESCPPPKNGIQPACGIFRVTNRKLQAFDPSSFSHLVKENFKGKERIEIYPAVGEVWALYEKQASELSSSELENHECQVVEIIGLTESCTKVSPLVPVKPYKSVFRSPRRQRSGTETMDIQKKELARFSHQIPAFQLTTQRGGSLVGCWQLDPASVPRNLVSGK